MVDQPMFHVVLECEGLHSSDGPQAAVDITEEFTHRPWQKNVSCTWDGHILRLEVDNDFDPKGLASRDEFSDVIVACVVDAEYSDLRVVSVTEAN